MLKIDSYSAKGIKSATAVTLPKEWEEKENPRLLAQAIRVYNDRQHSGLHKAQTRSEVNRTTKKLYKQKGTGGARHGARSAPIFVGGGVAHGPRPVSRELTLPTAIKRKAVAVAISLAVKEKRVFAGDLGFKKTKETQNFITKILGKTKRKTTFIVNKDNLTVQKFMRNMENVKVLVFPSLNAYDVFYGGNIVFDKSIFAKEKKETKK